MVPSPQGAVLESIKVIATSYLEHVGQVVTIKKLGHAYSVYLDSHVYGYFNCIHDTEHSPDLRKFITGHRYKVTRMNAAHAWLMDVTLPECVHLPEGT